MRVEAAPPLIYSWLHERTGCLVTPDFRAMVAVTKAGRIAGMVGYSCWTPNSVQAHMAVDTPLAWRALLPWAFTYPFLESGRGLVLGLVSSANEKSLRLTRHLGFRETYRIREGHRPADANGPGADIVVFEMRREECRYLEPQHRRAA